MDVYTYSEARQRLASVLDQTASPETDGIPPLFARLAP